MAEIPEAFKLTPLTRDEIYAIKAMKSGEATAEQQQLVLRVIINKYSRSHDLCYVPNDSDQTSFLNGRAFVGQQMLKILNVPIGRLIVGEDDNVS